MILTVVEIVGLRVGGPVDDGKLDLFEVLALDAGSLRQPLLRVFEQFTLTGFSQTCNMSCC